MLDNMCCGMGCLETISYEMGWGQVHKLWNTCGSLQCPVQPLAGFMFGLLVSSTKGHLHLIESPSQKGPLHKYLLRIAGP